MSYLLDTNVISELVRPQPNKHVVAWFENIPNEVLYVSVLTLGEIRKGIEKIQDGEKKETLRLWLEHTLPTWFEDRILDINIEVADRWGRLQHELARPLPAIDSLLAATALHYDLRLITRNTKDFQYPQLNTTNPWQI